MNKDKDIFKIICPFCFTVVYEKNLKESTTEINTCEHLVAIMRFDAWVQEDVAPLFDELDDPAYEFLIAYGNICESKFYSNYELTNGQNHTKWWFVDNLYSLIDYLKDQITEKQERKEKLK